MRLGGSSQPNQLQSLDDSPAIPVSASRLLTSSHDDEEQKILELKTWRGLLEKEKGINLFVFQPYPPDGFRTQVQPGPATHYSTGYLQRRDDEY